MVIVKCMIALTLALSVSQSKSQLHGPVFLQEPPSHLTFSNTSGSQVSCSAHGSPNPQVEWLLQDGQTVSAVPGLRQSLGNGTLYFPPFRAEDYREDVHSTVYRCRASNLAGSILSRDVQVRAMVNQHYEVQVYHTHVQAGNTALLFCVIPPFVKKHVTVTSWSRDDSILLPGPNMGGRIVVTYGNGDLYIRSARAEDGLARYSCLTLHSLTQERKRSAPAILTITEPTGSMPPRLAPTVQSLWSADRDTAIHLTCPSQGNPPPTFTWYRESNEQLQAVFSSARYELLQDILLIKRLKLEDAGRWTCKASNHFGEQKLDIHLIVNGHLSVHILPQLQVINSGESSIFNCTVSGSPIGNVVWFRNGDPLHLSDDSRIRLLSPFSLMVQGVTRHDRGMYQCVVSNDRENAQGSAELRLGDTVPELQYTFIEQALRPGPQVSLRCSASGSPPPQFRWLLDGITLSEFSIGQRYAIGQYVEEGGDVISHLNISNVRVEDGGLYTCRAANSLGSAEHASRLNVYGPPFVRSIGPVKAVAGTDITLHCPYAGYPIASVTWKRDGQHLPLDLRHRLEDGGSLTINRLDPIADSDIYTCLVASREGDTAHRNIKLIVHSPPVLEPFSFPANLQEGGRAQVTCYITSGDMPIHFAWFKDHVPISSSLQVEERAAEFYSMLIFGEVSSKHSGAYTCVASNSAAKSNFTAHLMVKVAPQWVIEPQDTAILLGSPLTINCEAKGFPHPQVSWLRGEGKTSADYQPLLAGYNNGRSVLLGNGSIWFDAVNAEDEAHYLCRATNGIGPGLGKVIFLSVNEPARFDTPSTNVSTHRGAPITLVCDVHGDAPVEITWSLNSNKLEMHNYRYSISETKTDSGIRGHVIISHTDREDTGDYICRAENAFGRGEHTVRLAVQERPDAPAHLEVVEVVSRAVRLAWHRPFDGNSPITGYLVQYQILSLSHGEWEFAGLQNLTLPVAQQQNSVDQSISPYNVPPHRETALINSLLPATAYRIRMLAVNNIDNSLFTEDVVVRTQEEQPAEPPRDINVGAVSASELYVSWVVPPRETWNGDLLGYIVTWNEHGKSLNSSNSHTVRGWATTKVQLTGLRKYTRYDINVCAFNSVASGPLSATVVGTTREGVPEAPPLNITCSQISSQNMKISWIPPPTTMHGGLILGYKVYYKPIVVDSIDIPAQGEVKRTSSMETYLHSLYKYTNYTIKVLAFTSAGDGLLSPPLICTTEADVPGPPYNIKASALTGDSILVSWLPPQKPNGRIIHYTVYAREMGRIGKHNFYTIRTEDDTTQQKYQLKFEIRNLAELQTYEFWVSATTIIGEGEPTAIVTQTPDSKAPARIASFSQVLHKAIRSRVLLPCSAVGNPRPRTRWIYRDITITFSPYYEVTRDGDLDIHNADQSLAGNYTCDAKNIFGEDNITYTINVLLPPNPPHLEVQFTTATSIRLLWKQPEDGGTILQGYTISSKHDTDDWRTLDLSPEHSAYTFDQLQCGSVYHIYILAYNKVGKGSPSPIITAHTKGGPPLLPKDRDLIHGNATSVQLSLYKWPDGGCPISHFSIMYRFVHNDKWTLVSSSATSDKLIIQDLMPATWYQLKITAENDAGIMQGLFSIATTTLTGGHIPPPPTLTEDNVEHYDDFYRKAYIVTPTITVLVLLICVILLWWQIHKKQKRGKENTNTEQQVEDNEDSNEKIAERDSRRNCQQVYTSSPKSDDKMPDNASGMYEISPYATFSVPTNQNRLVTTSTLDYTMQFKTFGHIEEDDAVLYAKNPSGKSWHKARYYNNEGLAQSSSRLRAMAARSSGCGDSESDDTSGSPPMIGPGDGYQSSSSNYRVPVKQRASAGERDNRRRGTLATTSYTGYETLLVADLVEGESETGGGGGGASDAPVMVEGRRHHTPRHLSGGGTRYQQRQRQQQQQQHQVLHHAQHQPPSTSSSEDEQLISGIACASSSLLELHRSEVLIGSEGAANGDATITMPSGFSDHTHKFSEAECDRDHHLPVAEDAVLPPAKLSAELAALLARYQEQKEQERKEFTIHV